MRKRGISHRLLVIVLDLLLLLLINVALLVLYRTNFRYLGLRGVLAQMGLSVATVFLFRTMLGVYRQVWHYADAPAFMKLMIADILAMAVHYTVQHFLPFNRMSLMRTMALFAGNLLLAMSARMGWQYLYKIKSRDSRLSEMFRNIIENLTGIRIRPGEADEGAVGQKTNIAIVGAGRIGTALADELLANPRSTYLPVFFIDNDKEKIGRWISGLKVFDEQKVSEEMLAGFPVQEVVFALPNMDADRAREMYARYGAHGGRRPPEHARIRYGGAALPPARGFPFSRNPGVLCRENRAHLRRRRIHRIGAVPADRPHETQKDRRPRRIRERRL